jgi:hypothetical protein
VYGYIVAENEPRASKLISHLLQLGKRDKMAVILRKTKVLENKLEKLRKKEVLPLTLDPALKY